MPYLHRLNRRKHTQHTVPGAAAECLLSAAGRCDAVSSSAEEVEESGLWWPDLALEDNRPKTDALQALGTTSSSTEDVEGSSLEVDFSRRKWVKQVH